MAVVSGQTKRFTSASPVTRYWLTRCEGFSLAGGGRGTVERVVAGQLEVRQRGKVRRVPASCVLEIVPAEKLLVVRGTDSAAARRAALGHAAVFLLGVATLLATWLVRAGKETVRLVRSLPWQRYGHSVLSAMTRLWREISTTWSLLLTTSSEHSSAKSSARRARTTSST